MSSKFTTVAERSGFTETGGIEEVERLSAEIAAEWPDAVRSFEYGRSAEGRPMRALVASRCGSLSPAELRERGIPVIMIQGGIHPGESDGKDAGFIALRELLAESRHDDPLRRVAALFVPAFNTDGHERMGQWNRPNQNGPLRTGWRTTAQNLNLNRDYTKADAPEMRAMLRLIDAWDPLVCADLHVTDGADFEPDVSLQVEPINQGDPELWPIGTDLRDRLIERLAAQGSMPLAFYPDFVETDDPKSGFVLTVYSPRFSTGYFPQRNRFTVLVETHSWKPYAKRVLVTRNCVLGLIQLAALHGENWLAKTRAADLAACALGGAPLTLDFKSGWRETHAPGESAASAAPADAAWLDFRGYAYTRSHSDIAGMQVTAYDPRVPEVWHVPYRNRVEPTLVVRAPLFGYFVPQPYAAEIAARLEAHGIDTGPIPPDLNIEAIEEFTASAVSFTHTPFEGRMRATLAGQWRAMPRAIETSALFVPIGQPLARLVVALFEPQAPDSFAAWGFFNACFEQKEQLEPYVAEQIARIVLAEKPALRVEFERRLAEDAAFRGDPRARFEFFWRHHASWDERYNRYPVYRA
jgi:murein tripeptide amidase MpaA